MRTRLLLLLLALSFTLGCSTAKKARLVASSQLSDAVESYNESVRWGRVEKAVEFVEPADRETFLVAEAARAKQIRFTEVRVGKIDFPPGTEQATVPVSRTFYRNDELTERTETVIQHWYRKENHWFVKP